MSQLSILRFALKKNLGEEKLKEVDRHINDELIEEYFNTPYWNGQNYLALRKDAIKRLDSEKRHQLIVLDQNVIESRREYMENSLRKYNEILNNDVDYSEYSDKRIQANIEELEMLFGGASND